MTTIVKQKMTFEEFLTYKNKESVLMKDELTIFSYIDALELRASQLLVAIINREKT